MLFLNIQSLNYQILIIVTKFIPLNIFNSAASKLQLSSRYHNSKLYFSPGIRRGIWLSYVLEHHCFKMHFQDISNKMCLFDAVTKLPLLCGFDISWASFIHMNWAYTERLSIQLSVQLVANGDYPIASAKMSLLLQLYTGREYSEIVNVGETSLLLRSTLFAVFIKFPSPSFRRGVTNKVSMLYSFYRICCLQPLTTKMAFYVVHFCHIADDCHLCWLYLVLLGLWCED